MSHANAALIPHHRLRIARLIIDDGWPVSYAGLKLSVSCPPAKRRVDRDAAMGAVGVVDRFSRLHHIDKRTGAVVHRYDSDKPGAVIHVDVVKFGNIPDCGGRRFASRQQSNRNRTATAGRWHLGLRGPLIGNAFVQTVIDDTLGRSMPRFTATKRPRQRTECCAG